MSDDGWIERAQSAEARLKTCQDQIERVKETARNVCETLGAKMRSDGGADIDFDLFVERLGLESALQVRAIIDQRYSISGEPGAKPRVKVPSAA